MSVKQTEIYDPKIYVSISYDDLVTYALFSLLKKDSNSTFENLVEETFTLFPSRFHIIGHPEWPDSALINKCWLRCRSDKKYIIGSTARGFNLTPFGIKIAERVLGRLAPATKDTELIRMKGDYRSKAGKFVKHIEESQAFKLFREGNTDLINSLDFFELIFCTPDSLSQTKRKSLDEIRQYVELYNRDDIKKLLDHCEKRFAIELRVGKRRGMLRRKER